MTTINGNASDWARNLRGVTPRAKLLAMYLSELFSSHSASEAPERHITVTLSAAEEWMNLSPVELRAAFAELPNVVWRRSRFGHEQIDVVHVPGEDGFTREPL